MIEDPSVSELVEDNDGKVVSLAARQLFSGEVKYAIEAPAR